MEFLTIAFILVSLYIGWTIGANDAANCLGPSVGAGIIKLPKAILLVGASVLLGSILQGRGTIETVGTRVVELSNVGMLMVFCALLGAALLKTFYILKGIPVSTTQAVIGALLGISIFGGAPVRWDFVTGLFLAWLFTPLIAALFSFITYYLVALALGGMKLYFIQRYLKILVILSGIFLAYSLGANNIGNTVGFIVGMDVWSITSAGIIGGFCMALGVLFCKRTVKTVGMGITELDGWMAFAAQMGTAIAVYILTLFAIPTSITTAMIGSVAGVGLVKGIATIDRGQVFKILRSWFLTPILGGVFAVILFKIFELL